MGKSANVSVLYKSNDETDKLNYHPISLLCVPSKIMECGFAATVTSHIREHDLSNHNQWTYKKGQSTEHLLIRMTENWRQAIDNGLPVGVVFDTYLTLSSSKATRPWYQRRPMVMVTVVNGWKLEVFMKYGVHQRLALRPILSSILCSDLWI